MNPLRLEVKAASAEVSRMFGSAEGARVRNLAMAKRESIRDSLGTCSADELKLLQGELRAWEELFKLVSQPARPKGGE